MTSDAADDRFQTGQAIRRAVLGDAHVHRAMQTQTSFDADFQRYITEAAWGSVWSRPGLTQRERSMLVIALLAALGHHEELALHTRATARTGAAPDDLKEVLLHVAAYAGIPAANSAMRVVKRTLAEMAADSAMPTKDDR